MARFTKNEDGTVTDSKTGLTWSNTLGEDLTYKQAEEAVHALGEGWRIPSDEELSSIVDRTKHLPAINTEFFPDTKSDWYWTSTPTAWNDAAVWIVLFSLGTIGSNHRYGSACVRAVRSSQ